MTAFPKRMLPQIVLEKNQPFCFNSNTSKNKDAYAILKSELAGLDVQPFADLEDGVEGDVKHLKREQGHSRCYHHIRLGV